MEITVTGFEETAAWLEAMPTRLTTAMSRALNRGINSARTLVTREISRETGMRSRDVRDKLVLRQATATKLEASLAASLKRIPLMDFNARGTYPSRGKGRGVTYRIGSASRRLPKAFIAVMGSGHQGVFLRQTTRRLPIRELFGPSLGHIFGKYRAAGLARAEEIFRNNIDHELGFAGAGDLGESDG